MDAPFWVLVSCLIAIGAAPLVLAVLFYMATRFRQKEADRKEADK